MAADMQKISAYRKLGYRSRNDIMESAGAYRVQSSEFQRLFDNPCATVKGVMLYAPERAEAILFELHPGTRFNKMAVLFNTGRFSPT